MVTDHEHLAPALVAALGELTTLATDRTANAGSYSYSYADIADVVKATRPVLAEHGLVALTPVHAHGDGLACSVMLVHSSGEVLKFEPFPFPHGRDAQATGSMVTYHRRYALIAALGMAASADDDGATAHARRDEARTDVLSHELVAEVEALPGEVLQRLLVDMSNANGGKQVTLERIRTAFGSGWNDWLSNWLDANKTGVGK